MSESALTLISRAGRDGVPSLFARHDAVFAEGYAGIAENKRRGFEIEAVVLLLVARQRAGLMYSVIHRDRHSRRRTEGRAVSAGFLADGTDSAGGFAAGRDHHQLH